MHGIKQVWRRSSHTGGVSNGRKRVTHKVWNALCAALAFSVALAAGPERHAQPGGMTVMSIAHADDDDGDDGGGGVSAGGGTRQGGSSGSASRLRSNRTLMRSFRGIFGQERRSTRRSKARAARAAPRPAPPREIVGIDISDAQLALLVGQGYEVLARDPLANLGSTVTRLGVPRALSVEQSRAQVAALAPQATVDDNHLYAPQEADPQACLSRDCLARDLISWRLPDGAQGSCVAKVRIGMIDTAINRDHPALRNARVELVRLGDARLPESGRQHGTAVAALFVGAPDSRSPGLLPGASLVAVDIFSGGKGRGDVSDAYSLVRGLDLLMDSDVSVINLSLSGPDNALLRHGIEQAAAADLVVVAAAGNKGPRAAPVYPAAYPTVLAVTAVDRRKAVYRRAGQGAHVDISAPGVDVWTAASISGARPKSGTSFAAPFAAAAVAAWRISRPQAKGTDAVASLIRSAEDLGTPGRDDVYGWGLMRPRDLCSAPAQP